MGAKRAGVYAGRPLAHTPINGDITIHRLSEPPRYVGTLNIVEITDESNLRLTPAVVSPEAFDVHSHSVTEIRSGGNGHMYTTDKGESDWSIHIQKLKPNVKP